jgi:leucyl aminopeptidase
MTTPRFSVAMRYTPRDGDFVCAPYHSARKPAFPKELAPGGVKLATADDEGASRLLFLGTGFAGTKTAHGGIRTYRLDGPAETPAHAVRQMVASALKEAKRNDLKRVVVLLDPADESLALAVQDGALLGGYAFDKYLKKKETPLPVLLAAPGRGHAALKRALKREETVSGFVNFARDVLNEPAAVIHPPSLAREFQAAGRAAGLTVQVWDEKRLRREKCGGILAVGQGSAHKPRLVIGEYRPRGAKTHIALVGKGVTFDTGGYSLKPSQYQAKMKYDMGGAAMMFAAACAIAKLKLPVRVTVLTPLAQNDVSSEAFHVHDILATRNGTTVEVMNTDAEGRLILADALALAGEKEPDAILDAATLTGACAVALGEDIAGVYGTDERLTEKVLSAGEAAGEYLWRLPLHKPYAKGLKATIADCQNIAKSRYGGSITAALFLQKFVPDGVPWIHLDIAGPGAKEEPIGHLGGGAKGFGVKTMVRLAETLGGKR